MPNLQKGDFRAYLLQLSRVKYMQFGFPSQPPGWKPCVTGAYSENAKIGREGGLELTHSTVKMAINVAGCGCGDGGGNIVGFKLLVFKDVLRRCHL